MARLEELVSGAQIAGILPDTSVSVVTVQWFGSDALELTYKDPAGRVATVLSVSPTGMLEPREMDVEPTFDDDD